MAARSYLLLGALIVITSAKVYGQDQDSVPKDKTDPTVLSDVVVTGRDENLTGQASSATEGTVGAKELARRAFARPGEVMETIPGMIITQHTGGGKANQYYLRGFNLDHGTEFATFIDNVPINMPTHAHGPGYTDTNWLIPEIIEGVKYQKGPYDAEYGDYANVGAAKIKYFDVLPHNFAIVQGGDLGFRRAVFGGSPKIGAGHLLYTLEGSHNDGPWKVKNNYRRTNGILKWSEGNTNHGYSLALQGYQGIWNGADQVPQRAVDSHVIDRYGSLDPTTGGSTHRYSSYGEWHSKSDDSATSLVLYLIRYDLDLYSNFTYFIDQTNGDQIEQKDMRFASGLSATHSIYGKLFGNDTENTAGLQYRRDKIKLTLNHTQERRVVNKVRSDDVVQTNIGPWLQNKTSWLTWFRTVAGVRADTFIFDVDSNDLEENSGNKTASAVSPKLSLIFGPWSQTEFYLQGGFGIRSNDARGVTETRLPDDSGPANSLTPIARSRGAEVGIRSNAVDGLNTTLSFWMLDADSEIYFAGDDGASVDSGRPSRRAGIEWTNFYKIASWLTLDADFAASQAKYTDHDPAGEHVPEAIATVVAAGISTQNISALPGFDAGLRLRYFGPRYLIEDGSEKSKASAVLNAQTGYEVVNNVLATLEVLNVTDAKYNDVDYYFESRMKGEAEGPGEGGGYEDHMVHPGDPRSFRVGVTGRF